MINWHVGCSGFHYKHWKGLFYPEDLPQKNWFDFYCNYFDTLELNVTFYRFPQLSFLETWHKKTPEDFRFAVKAPKAITHFKKFTGTADMLADFYGTIRQGLKEKLGCVLFQLPPNYHYDKGKLDKIITSLDNSFLNVAEFRHESWWKEEVYKELARHNISFCGMSHPTLPEDVIANAGHLYFRFHGKTQLYTSRYSVEELKAFAKHVSAKKNVKHAFVYFNNDVHAHAVENARELIDIINK
jgi:uncharacterized protein YecE (DUF72 family)